MRRLIGLASLVFVGVLAWNIGGRLSSDAVGMAVGLIFGTLAGIPAALLVLATSNQRNGDYDSGFEEGRFVAGREMLVREAQHSALQPVIVVQQPAYTPARPFAITLPLSEFDADDEAPDWWHPGNWPPPATGRQFRITGEVE